MRLWRAIGAFIIAFAAGGPAMAAVYAVVIGIDDYRQLPKLSGALNDARDLSQALEGLGADIVLLKDHAATRAAVIAAIRAQGAKTGPDDLFVLTYAGHGIQEPEAISGDEADGFDETIVLSDFAFQGPTSAERLRDNEIGALLAEIDPAARKLVIFDSCHSGTMTRAFDARGRAVATRFGGRGAIAGDPLPAPGAGSKGQDLLGDNIVYAAAGQDEEEIPEVAIGGEVRGALSWAVARALEGDGDFGGPAMPLSRFRDYVRAQVRAHADARQTPDVRYDAKALAAATLAPPRAVTHAARAPTKVAGVTAPEVFVIGGGAGLAPLNSGAWTQSRGAADLIWDRIAGEVVDIKGGDLIAEAASEAAFRAVLAKWRAAKTLATWAPRRAFDISIRPGDGRHKIGARISLVVARPKDEAAYLTIVNLASTGEAQFVYPDATALRFNDDLIPPGEGPIDLGGFEIAPPVGADHVLALLTPTRPRALHDWLAGGPAAEAVIQRFRAEIEAAPAARIGVVPIFTQR